MSVPSPPSSDANSTAAFAAAPLKGTLHAFVAFDWGERVDLEHAARLVPAAQQALARRRRTPASFAYRPAPLRFRLQEVPFELPELGPLPATAEATLFDFGAVSVALSFPFAQPAERLTRLAGHLADPAALIAHARGLLEPLFAQLTPAMQQPEWSELSEEYFVFELPRGAPLPPPSVLLAQARDWLAALVRLEQEPLSSQEIAESLRVHISYAPDDLFVPEWSAALLIDADCDETLQTIEFANVQLLEFRFLDNRLDDQLSQAYDLIHRLAHTGWPLLRSYARPLRLLGDMKIEANDVFERTSNVLKLVGDQYLARVYRQLSTRFHLEDWGQSIHRSLEVLEGVYGVLSDEASHYRTELLEGIIVLLIVFEIAMTFWRGH
jgi:hypothetical protein